MVVVRWGVFWFGLSLSIVVGVMMLCYVAVPARLIGFKTDNPKRDKLAATAVGGAIGAVICTPPYVLGRVGLLMLEIVCALHLHSRRHPLRRRANVAGRRDGGG